MNVTNESNNRQNILRDASVFSGSSYVARIMFFVRGFLGAKILGPGLYGLWSALNIILNFSYYLNLGSIEAMGREISYQKGMRSEKGMQDARNSAFSFCLVVNFIFSFALIIFTLILWNRLSLVERTGLVTVAFLSFTFFIYEFYQTAVLALKKFLFIGKANMIFSILAVIMTILVVPAFKIYGVYIVTLLVSLVSITYLMFRSPHRLGWSFNTREISRLIKIGFPLMSIDFLETAIAGVTGIIVLLVLGKASLGYYSVAIHAARFLMYFQESVDRVFEPYMYQRYGETHKISELKEYLFKPSLVMALLFPIVLAVYYTVSAFFIRHFLPDYTASIPAFFIILVANFLAYFSPTAFSFITAVNKQRFLVPAYFIGIITAFASSLIFINMGFGIIGAAAGFLLASFFTGSVIFIYAASHYMKDAFKCLGYLTGLYLPLLYISSVLVFNEIVISSSFDMSSDIKKLIVKLIILLIASVPLIYIANKKTGIIFEFISFLKLDRFIPKEYRYNLGYVRK